MIGYFLYASDWIWCVNVQGPVLVWHTDAVWSLASAHGRLLSASADGTARLWAPRGARPLLATLRADDAPTAPAPAAADFADAGARAAVVYRDGSLLLYDLETTQVTPHFLFRTIINNSSQKIYELYYTLQSFIELLTHACKFYNFRQATRDKTMQYVMDVFILSQKRIDVLTPIHRIDTIRNFPLNKY